MAYDKTGLTLADVSQVDRTKKFLYTKETDTLATIKGSGYFTPDATDYDDLANKIEVGNFIQIKGSDGGDMIWVQSLSPIVTVSVSDSEDIALNQGNVFRGSSDNKAEALDVSAQGAVPMGNGTDVVATNVFAGVPVYMGSVTWSGGGATLAHTVTGVAETDIVMALWQAAPTEASDISLAVATADTITFTASAANTSNDGVVGYVVFRAPAAAP